MTERNSLPDIQVVPLLPRTAETIAEALGGKVLFPFEDKTRKPAGIKLSRNESIIFNLVNHPEHPGTPVTIFRRYEITESRRLIANDVVLGKNTIVELEDGQATMKWISEAENGPVEKTFTLFQSK